MDEYIGLDAKVPQDFGIFLKERLFGKVPFRLIRYLGIDAIPLQQSFGHIEYISCNNRYAEQGEDQKDMSQVYLSKEELNKALFTDLFAELASTHPSKYIHIGGDETH